jgi:hypothetical protein
MPAKATATMVGILNGSWVMKINEPIAPGTSMTPIRRSSEWTTSSAAAVMKAQAAAANRAPEYLPPIMTSPASPRQVHDTKATSRAHTTVAPEPSPLAWREKPL